MSESKRILVSGSLAFDRIMNFPGLFSDHILPDKLHTLNVSFTVRTFRESYGGTAGNIAYSLALLGLRPVVLANAGNDFAKYARHLRSHKVNLSLVQRQANVPTATATIMTDSADNQIAGFFPGAMVRPFVLSGAPRSADLAIVAPGNIIDMQRLPMLFRKRGVRFIFDPGQQTISLSASALANAIRGSDVLIGNDYEIALIQKKTRFSKSALLKKTRMLITTLGADGSLIERAGHRSRIPAVTAKSALDPTGAGDAYRAGLLYGLTRRLSPERSARLGALVAVYTVERYGTQTHAFSRRQIHRRYQHLFHESL